MIGFEISYPVAGIRRPEDLLDRLLYITKRLPAIGLLRDALEPDPHLIQQA